LVLIGVKLNKESVHAGLLEALVSDEELIEFKEKISF